MSYARCECGALIDTDDDPESTDYKRDAFVCAYCRGDEDWAAAVVRSIRMYDKLKGVPS